VQNAVVYVECSGCVLAVAAALGAAGCERISTKSGDKPIGVVWHVFRPQDADRIRSFVDKVRVCLCQNFHYIYSFITSKNSTAYGHEKVEVKGMAYHAYSATNRKLQLQRRFASQTERACCL